jgi:hypothetical protein
MAVHGAAVEEATMIMIVGLPTTDQDDREDPVAGRCPPN